MNFDIGDIVELKKTHPCGGKTWKIVRVGADIRLVCNTCGSHVMIPRTKFVKLLKKVVQSNPENREQDK